MNKALPLLDGRLRKSIEILGDLRRKKIINVGCKGAWLESYLSNKKIPLKEMHSFDIEDYDFPKLDKKFHFSIDSALDMKKFEGKNFDVATFFEVIEHIPKNTELIALRRINKSLKIGGKLFLSTPNKSFFSNILDPAWWLIGHRHYSAKQLTSFMEKSGFKVIKSDVRGGFAELIFMNSYYLFKNIFRTKKFGKNLFRNKRNRDYLEKSRKGFATIFIIAEKIRDVKDEP